MLIFIAGCQGDTIDAIGTYIARSSDVQLSKFNNINFQGQGGVIGVYAIASKFIGIFKSGITNGFNGYEFVFQRVSSLTLSFVVLVETDKLRIFI